MERSVASPWEDDHEHHRPSVLGRGPQECAKQRYASFGHEREEEKRRFARDVRAWLSRLESELDARPAAIFAAPRFLGLLREELTGEAGEHLREGELTSLRPSELAVHPAVVGVLDASLAERASWRVR